MRSVPSSGRQRLPDQEQCRHGTGAAIRRILSGKKYVAGLAEVLAHLIESGEQGPVQNAVGSRIPCGVRDRFRKKRFPDRRRDVA